MKRWGLIIGLTVVVLVLLAGTALWLAARSEKGHQLVMENALPALEEALQAKISVARVSGNLFGDLLWEGIRISRDDVDLIVEKLSLNLDLKSLRHKKIKFSEIEAIRPLVILKQSLGQDRRSLTETDLKDEKPTAPQPGVGPEPEPGGPSASPTSDLQWQAEIEELRLSEARIQGLAQALNRPELGDLEITSGNIGLELGEKLSSRFKISGRFEWAGTAIGFRLDGRTEDRLLRLAESEIRIGRDPASRIVMEGELDLAAQSGKVKYRSLLNPAKLPLFHPAQAKLKNLQGPLAISGDLDGDLAGLTYSAKINWRTADLAAQGRFEPLTGALSAQGSLRNFNPSLVGPVVEEALPTGLINLNFDLEGVLPGRLEGRIELFRSELLRLGRVEKADLQGQVVGRDISGSLFLQGFTGQGMRLRQARVKGRWSPSGGRAEIGLEGFKGHGAEIREGRIKLDYDGHRLSFKDLEINQDGGGLTGHGAVNLDQGRVIGGRAELKMDNLNPPTNFIWSMMGTNLALIDLSSVRLSGPVKADWPGAKMTIDCPALRLDSTWGRIKGPIKVGLTGQGALERYSADLDVSQFSVPEWLFPYLPAELRQGMVNGRVKVTGRGDRVWFEARLRDSSLAATKIDRLDLVGSLEPGQLKIKNLDLAAAGLKLRAGGDILPKAHLKVSLSGGDPQKLPAIPGLPQLPVKASSFGFEGLITGVLTDPAVKGRIFARRLSWNNYQAKLVRARLDLTGLGAGSLPKGRLGLKVEALSGLPSEPLNLSLNLAETKGVYRGRITASGKKLKVRSGLVLHPGRDPSRPLVVRLEKTRAESPAFGGRWQTAEPILFNFKDHSDLSIATSLLGPHKESVRIDLRKTGEEFQGSVKLQRLDLRPWAGLLGLEGLEKGLLEADLGFSGRLTNLRADLHGAVSQALVMGHKIDRLTFSGNLKDHRATLSADLASLGKNLLTIRGSLPFSRSPGSPVMLPEMAGLKVSARAEQVSLAIFDPLIRPVRKLTGRLSANVELTPTERRGWLEADRIGLTSVATGQRFEHGRVRLELEGDSLVVKRFEAQTGGGKIEAGGKIKLASGMPLQMALSMSPAVVNIGPLGQGKVESAIQVRGSLQKPILKGLVKVLRLDFQLPKPEPEEAREIILVDSPPTASGPASQDNLAMDLDIDLGKGMNVRGEGLKALLDGQLKALKEPGDVVRISGRLKVVQGTFTRFSKRFTIQRGEIVFQGRNPPDPALNLNAQVRKSGIDIYLNVSGYATKPELVLTSNPSLSREDILAYLLFGQSADSLNQAQSGKLEHRALGALSGPATEIMKGLAGDKLAPDLVSISSDVRGGLSVETGKQILPNLYISYVAFSEPSKPNEVRVEYRITPNVAVESSVGDPLTTGVEVNFKWDF